MLSMVAECHLCSRVMRESGGLVSRGAGTCLCDYICTSGVAGCAF